MPGAVDGGSDHTLTQTCDHSPTSDSASGAYSFATAFDVEVLPTATALLFS